MSKQKPNNPVGNPNWRKGGPSPNPAGRPKTGLALAEWIRAEGDKPECGKFLVHLMWRVATGRSVPIDEEFLQEYLAALANGDELPPIRGQILVPDLGEMMRAAEWLADRAYNKPTQEHIITASNAPQLDYGKLTDEELARLEDLHQKMLTGITQGVLTEGDDE